MPQVEFVEHVENDASALKDSKEVEECLKNHLELKNVLSRALAL